MSNDDHFDSENDKTHLLNSAYDHTEDTDSAYDHTEDTEQVKQKPCAEESDKSRWLSIRLIYMTSFMNYVSFTITLASLWAYLKVLEPNATTSTLGLVVSAYAMGQIVSGPLFGYWANRRTIKEPLVVSLVLNLIAYIFYMYLANMPSHRGYYMVASRLLIGFSSGTVPLSRAYVANATSQSERTSAIANTNICGAVGFILGPLIQAALVPISYPGPVESSALHFNMYTAPILLSTVVTLINVVVIMLLFKEYRINEVEFDGVQSTEQVDGDVGIDYLAAIMCIVFFFSSFLNFAFLETITMPLIMHMFTWTKAKATLIQSFVIGGTALLSIPVYVVIKILSSRMREKTLLLCGFVVSLMSYLVLLPWGHDYPNIQEADIHNESTITSTQSSTMFNEDSNSPSLTSLIGALTSPNSELSLTLMTSHNETSNAVGCPWQYEWCRTVPALKLPQYVLAMFLFGIGYPITNVMTISIFSKILGPKPMGLWMGFLIASGCLSGIVGPIIESTIYDQYGPRISFITLSAFMVATIMLILFVFKRLIPFGQRQRANSNNTSINKV